MVKLYSFTTLLVLIACGCLAQSPKVNYNELEVLSIEQALEKPLQAESILIFSDDESVHLFRENYTKLTNLKVLQLIGGGVDELKSVIPQIHSLRQIKFNRCELSICPEFIRSMNNLEEVDLAGNNIAEFPYELAQLERLSVLTFGNGLYGGNTIDQLDARIGQFGNLLELRLFQNPVATISPEIGQLKQLEYLDLNQCRLSEINTGFSELNSLQVLKISHNNLKQYPQAILKLKNLQELQCVLTAEGGNLPSFSNLVSLRDLSISLKGVEQIPEELGELSSLTKLTLTDCTEIKHKDVIALCADLSALQSLYLYSSGYSDKQKQSIKARLTNVKVVF